MTNLEPVITQNAIVPYFDIVFTNTLPEGETEFTFSFPPHPGCDHWEVQCMEGDTDWEVKPDGWFEVVIGWGEETYLTHFHHLNQIIHLSLERQHVMKVGNSSQLRLRGRGIALMDKA